MFTSSSMNENNKTLVRYHWTDPMRNTLTLKEAVVYKWKKDDREGIIGMGYTVNDLSDTITIMYKDYVDSTASFFYLLVTALVTILLMNRNIFMALIFFTIALSGYIIYVKREEFLGSTTTENTKTKNMNSKILSISFLLGVNIFILKTLENKYSIKTFADIAVIFSISLILILSNIFNLSSSSNVSELMKERISKQLIFNLSVILNMYIILTYFVHIFNTKKIWKRLS